MSKKAQKKGQEPKQKGFTLIEILVVVALIAILAAITIIAINPAKNFADARNTQRSSDATQILNAITQFVSDGNTLGTLGTIPLCATDTVTIGSGVGNLNLATNLVPVYISAIPKDPTAGTDADTGYTICQTAATSGRIRVDAPNAENGKTISVQR